MIEDGGTLYFVRTDHIGRPVFASQGGGTGTIDWTASYLPFGKVRTSTGNPIALRFPGQWYQSESGLHQNWMREYDPTTGRYLQADPLGLVDGPSVYGYAMQNPGRYTDFNGLEVNLCCRPAQIAGGLIDHCWVRTDTISAGMGANPGDLPGEEYEGYGMQVQIIDHSRDAAAYCIKQNNVNEQCVNDELEFGKPLGRFLPPFNQCQSFAYSVLNRCRTGPQY